MRISDWSSDVCSSDLRLRTALRRHHRGQVGELLRLEREQLIARLRRLQRAACRLTGRHQRVDRHRSEEHTSELQSLMRISYAVFCLKKKKYTTQMNYNN